MWSDDDEDAVAEPAAPVETSTNEDQFGQDQPDGDQPANAEPVEPVASVDQSTVAEPEPQPADPSSFRRSWLLMVVGALLGAFIALGAMYLVNDGNLSVANHPKIVTLETELTAIKQREESLGAELSALKQELVALEGIKSQVENTRAEIAVLKQSKDSLARQLTTVEQRADTLESRASTVEGRVSSLEDSSDQLATAVEAVEARAQRFDAFLTGLQELLQAAPESE